MGPSTPTTAFDEVIQYFTYTLKTYKTYACGSLVQKNIFFVKWQLWEFRYFFWYKLWYIRRIFRCDIFCALFLLSLVFLVYFLFSSQVSLLTQLIYFLFFQLTVFHMNKHEDLDLAILSVLLKGKITYSLSCAYIHPFQTNGILYKATYNKVRLVH